MKPATLLLILIALLPMASAALAQSGGNYGITRWNVPGGGGNSTGGLYALNSTVGQTAAGDMSGGDYDLGSGFWGGESGAEQYTIYLPLVLRD